VPGQIPAPERDCRAFRDQHHASAEALRELERRAGDDISSPGAVVTKQRDDTESIYDITPYWKDGNTPGSSIYTGGTFAQLLYIDEMDNHIGDLVTLVKLNHKFHITLYAASGRRHLFELTSMLRFRTQHYLHAFITYMGGMPQAQFDHRAILAACRDKDAERAASLIYEHVIHVGNAIVEYIRQQEE
jgi:hypothetical protein